MAAAADLVWHFPGLHDVLPSASASGIEMDDITEDVAAEQETLVKPSNRVSDNVCTMDPPLPSTSMKSIDAPDFARLQSTLMDALKGVTEGTSVEYKWLMNTCVMFLAGLGLLGSNEEFFCKKPRADAPWLIIAWIMNMSDSLNIDGTMKPSTQECGTYGHAQKMHASMTYAFCYDWDVVLLSNERSKVSG
ncbi:uncharacterized protein F5147DRAFT_769894 [Suillus discolor]|uniref:Uncharacterized protein n=1 Tax=Suillus discolor TaxID=1912936 RepID=A0A9P7JY36_9AGAM|nr:uncharacterized protein F5147DRAFT_769894 [Suillus discolor]KAG2114585.1 hypothetical protein F5147DRAFT_769894 [Suillus discolor]